MEIIYLINNSINLSIALLDHLLLYFLFNILFNLFKSLYFFNKSIIKSKSSDPPINNDPIVVSFFKYICGKVFICLFLYKCFLSGGTRIFLCLIFFNIFNAFSEAGQKSIIYIYI